MTGGARIPSANFGRTSDVSSNKPANTASAPFQETLGRAITSDPKASFTTLSRVLQNNEVSYGNRVDGFRQIAHRIISNPSHPYAHIEAQVRNEMINNVAEALAGSHLKLKSDLG